MIFISANIFLPIKHGLICFTKKNIQKRPYLMRVYATREFCFNTNTTRVKLLAIRYQIWEPKV